MLHDEMLKLQTILGGARGLQRAHAHSSMRSHVLCKQHTISTHIKLKWARVTSLNEWFSCARRLHSYLRLGRGKSSAVVVVGGLDVTICSMQISLAQMCGFIKSLSQATVGTLAYMYAPGTQELWSPLIVNSPAGSCQHQVYEQDSVMYNSCKSLPTP